MEKLMLRAACTVRARVFAATKQLLTAILASDCRLAGPTAGTEVWELVLALASWLLWVT